MISRNPFQQKESAQSLSHRYSEVRSRTMNLVQTLSEADAQAQSMPDASPAKWHLAHTSWFFETFILERFEDAFEAFHPAFRVLFNSYYNGVGQQHPRAQRGLITRPSFAEIKDYRRAVDQRVGTLIEHLETLPRDASQLIELGLQHEQQHQELILTDLKHLFSCNPLNPVFREQWPLAQVASIALDWVEFEQTQVSIGFNQLTDGVFCFDNETPRHKVALAPFAIANRLVTNGDWREFMDDGGYTDPRWWLSAGWEWRRNQGALAPAYWTADSQDWSLFTLHGRIAIDDLTPVVHINLYEADAYARWRSARDQAHYRLPTEFEWEHAARSNPLSRSVGNFAESNALHPMPCAQAVAGDRPNLLQFFGDVWEWTSSSYAAYPGYRPLPGAVGEYNGKFMINQYVLRGGSCATPRDHIRASYRNFFPAETRWQFSGMRLIKELF